MIYKKELLKRIEELEESLEDYKNNTQKALDTLADKFNLSWSQKKVVEEGWFDEDKIVIEYELVKKPKTKKNK